jgi:hypothetical protein
LFARDMPPACCHATRLTILAGLTTFRSPARAHKCAAAISVPLVFNPQVTAAHHAMAVNNVHTAASSVTLVQFVTTMSTIL